MKVTENVYWLSGGPYAAAGNVCCGEPCCPVPFGYGFCTMHTLLLKNNYTRFSGTCQ